MTNHLKRKYLIYHVKKYGMPAVNISKFEYKKAVEPERFDPFMLSFRYDDTGEIHTIDTRDDDAFDMIFASDRPITMLLGKGP